MRTKSNREMIVILAGITMCVAWPGAVWLLLSRLHAPEWLIGLAGAAAFFLAIWAYLTLQTKYNGE